MCSLEEALEKILTSVVPLPAKHVSLKDAFGHYRRQIGFIAGEFAARGQFLRGWLCGAGR